MRDRSYDGVGVDEELEKDKGFEISVSLGVRRFDLLVFAKYDFMTHALNQSINRI